MSGAFLTGPGQMSIEPYNASDRTTSHSLSWPDDAHPAVAVANLDPVLLDAVRSGGECRHPVRPQAEAARWVAAAETIGACEWGRSRRRARTRRGIRG